MIILQALYFMLPVYFANMAPVFATKIFGNIFAWPLDFNKTINNKAILGKHKTWRGLIVGILIGTLVVWLQSYLYNFDWAKSLSLIDYSIVNIWLYGFLFGFGVIFGDALKSLIKRRQNLKPGAKWMPWDQFDFLGGLFFIFFVFIPSWPVILIILIISPFLPIMANWLGYILKIKKVSW